VRDHWDDLRRELHDTSVWLGGNADVSAYVGMDEAGVMFGGAHIDGEVLDDVDVLYRNGDAEDVVIEIIRQLRAYRKHVDEERANG
jgi:hypothetical protein